MVLAEFLFDDSSKLTSSMLFASAQWRFRLTVETAAANRGFADEMRSACRAESGVEALEASWLVGAQDLKRPRHTTTMAATCVGALSCGFARRRAGFTGTEGHTSNLGQRS